jgi:hypothetical protein
MTLRVRFLPNAAAMRRLAGRIALPLTLAVLAACSGGGNGGGSGNNAQSSPTLSSVAISPSNPSVNFGDSATLSATARFSDGSTQVITNSSDIAWSSSDPSIAQVSPANAGSASVTTIARGKATVVAQYKGKPGTTFVTVVPVLSGVAIEPNPLDVPPEFSENLSAIAQFNDGKGEDVTEQAVWRSSDIALATVSDSPGSKGLITGVKSGTATITAQYAGFTGSIGANVVPTRLVGVAGLVFPPPNGLLVGPAVARDGLGHAHAVWGYQGSGEVFYGGHDGTDWTDRIQINTSQPSKDFVFGPRIVVNAAGARMILWQGLSAAYSVYAAPGQPFGPVQIMLPNLANLSFGSVGDAVLTPSGDAYVAWGGQNTTQISRYNAVSGSWDPPVSLAPLPTVDRIRFNSNGDAVLAWQTDVLTGNPTALHAAIYLNDGTGVQATRDLAVAATTFFEIATTINANRDAVVVWGGSSPGIAQHSLAQGWQPNQALPTGDARSVDDLRVAMNPSNQIFVAWADQLSLRPYATHFDPNGGWQPAEALTATQGLGSGHINAIAVADSGNAICFFTNSPTLLEKEFKYRRFTAGNGWGPLAILNDPGLVGEPNEVLNAAYNANGQGVIGWNEASAVSDGSGGLIFTSFNFMELAPNVE